MDSIAETPAKIKTKAVFDWADPFDLDAQLSEDDRMVRDTANAYTQEKLAPRIIEAFREEKTDPEIFREMGALGLLGVTVSQKYGGAVTDYGAGGVFSGRKDRGAPNY